MFQMVESGHGNMDNGGRTQLRAVTSGKETARFRIHKIHDGQVRQAAPEPHTVSSPDNNAPIRQFADHGVQYI